MAEVRRESMRIAGEHVACERVIEVENPWNGEVVGTVPRATVADVRRAFTAARAFRAPLSRHERSLILTRRRASRRPARGDLGPHHRGIRPLQEGHALRGGARRRRLHLRRPRRPRRRQPDLPCDVSAQAGAGASTRSASPCAPFPPSPPSTTRSIRWPTRWRPPSPPTTRWCSSPRKDPAHRAPPRRHPLRGGAAARHVLGGDGRSRRDRGRAHHQPGFRADHLHRRRGGRQAHRRQDGLSSRRPRAGRQRPSHRDGGRRSPGGLDPRSVRRLQELRPALHRGQTHPRPGFGRRPLRGSPGGKDGAGEVRDPMDPTVDMGMA